MAKLLVIDDDRAVLRLVEKTFAGSDIEVLTARTAEDGLSDVRNATPDVLLLDIMLGGENGLEIATQVLALDPKLPIVFITASDDSDTAIEAMSRGAYDYLIKPLDREHLEDVVERALASRQLMQQPVHILEIGDVATDGDVMLGRSEPLLEVYKQIGRVAPRDVAVLIRGESGTGKELVARAIYQHSARRDQCFMAINCAALSDTLLESEMFGHEKGAFTGADSRHIGKFEQCNGGTLFLDEVGDMSPSTQSKVLRVLQEQEFERVGGNETIATDVRIVSATNRDLESMIDDNEFRLDLFHRLNAFEITLPPLRERGDDVQLLLEHSLAMHAKQLGKPITGFSEEALRALLSYRWPGNVRELHSVVRKALLMSTGPVLLAEFLPEELTDRSRQARERTEEKEQKPPADKSNGEASNGEASNAASGAAADFQAFLDHHITQQSPDLYAESLQWMERLLLTTVLRHTGGNQSKAAESLGITRGSLRHKLRALNISIDQVVSSGE